MDDKQNWDKQKTINLIRQVRYYEELWNKNDPHFRDKSHKDGAWYCISMSLATGIDKLQTKWRSLQSAYRRERRKLEVKNETSCWFAYDAMQFMDNDLVEKIEDKDPELPTSKRRNTNSGLEEEYRTTADPLHPVQTEEEVEDEVVTYYNSEEEPVVVVEQTTEKRNSAKRARKQLHLNPENGTFEDPKNIKETSTSDIRPRDEYDSFGEMIGNFLRDLENPRIRLNAMNQFFSLIIETKKKSL